MLSPTYNISIIPKVLDKRERREWENVCYEVQEDDIPTAIKIALNHYNDLHPEHHLLAKECWYLVVPEDPVVREPTPVNDDDAKLLARILASKTLKWENLSQQCTVRYEGWDWSNSTIKEEIKMELATIGGDGWQEDF